SEVRQSADAPGDGIVELARVGLGIRHELFECFCRDRRMHHQDLMSPRDTRDRNEISARVVAWILGDRGEGCEHAGVCHQQRMAVRGGTCKRFRRSFGVYRLVFDNHSLPESWLQAFSNEACGNISRAAWKAREDDRNGLAWIGFLCSD